MRPSISALLEIALGKLDSLSIRTPEMVPHCPLQINSLNVDPALLTHSLFIFSQDPCLFGGARHILMYVIILIDWKSFW
jgi:hypothetical protein